MAGYPVFQPQAPNIDISLFGDAAKAGAELGKEIPSAFSSAVSGIEQGVKFATDIQAEDARTEALKVQTQNEQLALERNQANQDAQLQADNSKLTLEADQADNADKQLTAQNEFYDQYSQADLQTKGQLLKSGNPIFLQNPGLFKNALTQYAAALPPDSPELPQINRLLGHASLEEYYQKKVLENQDNYNASRANAFNGKGRVLTSQISQQLQVPEELAPNSVDLLPAGKYVINQENNTLERDVTGKNYRLVDNETYKESKELNSGRYIAVSNLPDSKGLVVSQDVSKDAYDSYNAYLKDKSVANGQQLSYAKRNFDASLQGNRGQNSQQNTNTNIPTFNDHKGFGAVAPEEAPQTPQDGFRSVVQKNLNLSDDTTKEVAPLIDKLYDLSRGYIQNPTNRSSLAYNTQLQQTIKGVARQISDKQYQSNVALQALYTVSHVDANNAALDEAAKQIDPFDQYGVTAMFDSQKVGSPEDLYYNNYGVLTYKRLFDLTYGASNAAIASQQKRASYSKNYQDINKSLTQTAAGNGG